MILKDSEKLTIYYFIAASNSLSIIGSLFICMMYYRYLILRTFLFKLVLILTIFDIFSSIGFLLPTYNLKSSESLCLTQALTINFFTSASVYWTGFIAISLYFIIVKSRLYIENYTKHAVICVLSLCFILSAIPLFTKSYGKNLSWCWINQTSNIDSGFFERYFMFFIPLWVLVIINTLLFIKVSKRLKISKDSDGSRSLLNKKLKFYPLVLIICFLPLTLDSCLRYGNFGFVEKNEFVISIVVGFIRGFYGFANALVYGFTKKVRNTLDRSLRDFNSSEMSERVLRGESAESQEQYATKNSALTGMDILVDDYLLLG
ncbi:hypothetical protein SteCoe_16747 [Stentor coeruleus]|uniref:G-protein coupled receptors family 2 profile 2 domain-containing protein n=1 Tax=Stentor coeruleus TaxID=5963 RepID=A0A1R2C0I2_9CILI|nr:hypothetical protein SteCoe_16747 [Stentor coeruleus]